MKTIFKSAIITFFAAILLTSCGQEKPKELYCGISMGAFEVLDAKKAAENFSYTDADKTLLADVTAMVKAFAGENPAEVYFFQKDDTSIGIYIVAPDDKALVEKISCGILNSTLANLPDARKVVFYTNDHNNLVAAIKSKPKE
ncbi:hypothetical protein ACLI09_11855 [Flavobacterium sp. RHBU_24]|uniref:hypothetical protein n=1 Tax=Flavobacterium sp. RHBU_24 TaxID=3391185 RepID=UPI00398508F1